MMLVVWRRPKTISEEKVRMLEEINCHRMSIGIESGNQKYAQTMLKRMATNRNLQYNNKDPRVWIVEKLSRLCVCLWDVSD